MSDNNERIDTFAKRLNQAMTLKELKAVDLIRMTGIKKQKISQYVNGLFEAKQEAVYLLAKALNVNEAWLMGYDVPMEKKNCEEFDNSANVKTLAHEVNLIEQIQNQYGKAAIKLLKAFAELNDVGQEEAVKRVEELTEIMKYTEKRDYESLNA